MTKRLKPDSEERVLMPRSAPRVAVRPGLKPARSAEERAARAEHAREARSVATLAAQLGALEQDIRTVRRAARHAAPGLGLLAPRNHAARMPHGERVRLPDGAEILVRPVEPADAAQLRAGFARLGAVSRYRRFLAPMDDLTPAQLAYLTRVDHTSHEAIAALDPATGDGIGIARFLRDPADPRTAEAAIVVTDTWQQRGVATVLTERLAARARAAGVECLTARMIAGNDAARRLIAHVADTVSEKPEGGTVLVTARLRSPLPRAQ